MRPFNIFIIIFIIVLVGGFVFFKDGFIQTEKDTHASAQTLQQIRYDRSHYLDYSETNLLSSEKFGRTILFFAATTWCSNCAQLDKAITQNVNKLPNDLTILKVDYDRDTQTKDKYSVTMQTTLVLLDKNGNEIKRWIGTGSFNDLMKNIN